MGETDTSSTTTALSLKPVRQVLRSAGGHWVGDGFPVRTLFGYDGPLAAALSPFLLLDYAGPAHFAPTTARRGVGSHPHRGFETVTIVYAGEVEHRDSAGGGGRIGPGDVQWMTAAGGLVHEEFHGTDFAGRGGAFEMVQLWVNLPARDKMGPPRYQGITAAQIPEVALPDGAGTLRVIAGDYPAAGGPGTAHGPTKTFTPIHVWDIRLDAGRELELALPEGHTTVLVVLRGGLHVAGAIDALAPAQAALFARSGDAIRLRAGDEPTTALLLSGEPIHEPIVGHGPFVMNTADEIHQAIRDFQAGKMGRLT